MSTTKVLIVIGSTRPVRIGDQVATVVAEAARAIPSVEAAVEDLALRGLPLLDEPAPAAMGSYVHLHSQEWAAAVDGADAVVFVTPEYNAGYPAALKNAIDYLYSEWEDKPALIVSYGSRGGPRVQMQLAEVARSLKMQLTDTRVEVSFARSDFDSLGRLSDPHHTVSSRDLELRQALAELVELATQRPIPAEALLAVA